MNFRLTTGQISLEKVLDFFNGSNEPSWPSKFRGELGGRFNTLLCRNLGLQKLGISENFVIFYDRPYPKNSAKKGI